MPLNRQGNIMNFKKLDSMLFKLWQMTNDSWLSLFKEIAKP